MAWIVRFNYATVEDGFRKILQEVSFKSIKHHVCENWGDDASLWRPRLGVVVYAFFHIARLQPFPEYHLIHRDMGEHPIMTDVIEATLDIAFHYPLCCSLLSKQRMELFTGICCRTSGPKAVGIRVSNCFRHWFQGQQVECLHSPVFHGWDTKWA
jgi:hypothetical protein